MPSGNLTRRLVLGASTALTATASLVTTAALAPSASAVSSSPATTNASASAPAAPHCAGKRIDRYTVRGIGPVKGRVMGTVSLFYDGSRNCAYFERSGYDKGHKLPIDFLLGVGKRAVRDSGDYLHYAGPLTLPGRGECVTIAVRERVNQHTLVDWRVGPVHCGRAPVTR